MRGDESCWLPSRRDVAQEARASLAKLCHMKRLTGMIRQRRRRRQKEANATRFSIHYGDGVVLSSRKPGEVARLEKCISGVAT